MLLKTIRHGHLWNHINVIIAIATKFLWWLTTINQIKVKLLLNARTKPSELFEQLFQR
jgi:hypothetical protein